MGNVEGAPWAPGPGGDATSTSSMAPLPPIRQETLQEAIGEWRELVVKASTSLCARLLYPKLFFQYLRPVNLLGAHAMAACLVG